MTTTSPEREIEGEGGQEEDDQADAQTDRRHRNRIAEKIAQPDPPRCPHGRARSAVAEEARDARPGRPGQSSRDRVQLGYEPGAQLKRPEMSAEDMPSAMDQ